MKSMYYRIAVSMTAALLGFCAYASPGIRAAYLDFRTQVMTIDAMKEFAEDIAGDGLNAVVVEWEASFPFEENAVLRNRFAFSRSEVEEFISYCSSLGVEVIPLQNCFGHSEYILRHDRYSSLKEDRKDCSQVCPSKPDEAAEVFESIFREVASVHPSRYMHIGCDETRLLGHCPECRKKVAEGGISSLYVDYVSRMCDIVTSLGKTPVIWADIILKHPEAIDRLPDNVILADWNYGWSPDYFGKMENILKSGHEIWGACSLRSHPDNLYLVQWRKHLDNIFDYTSYTAAHGFSGVINTSWSTSGTYGYIYDDGYEVVDLQPVREVYPQNGFDMLMQAYSDALSGRCDDADSFLDGYCRTSLGLADEEDIEAVMDYFNMKQVPASAFGRDPGKAAGELEKCVAVRDRFSEVKFPEKARESAAHLGLMLDIRINYLEFKIVEFKTQQPGFTDKDAASLLEELGRVLSDCERLRKKFISLERGYLKDPGKPFDGWTYYGKMMNLKAVLENMVGN